MSEDLLDLENLSAPENKSPSPVGAGTVESTSIQGSNGFKSSSMTDLWGLSSPSMTSATTIPRFAEMPPDSTSSALFPSSPSVSSSTGPIASGHANSATKSTESTLLQLQDLWYAPQTDKTPTKLSGSTVSTPTNLQAPSLPPVMSPTPPPHFSAHTSSASPETKEATKESYKPAIPIASDAPQSERPSSLTHGHVAHKDGTDGKVEASQVAIAASGSHPPPFQIWSKEGSESKLESSQMALTASGSHPPPFQIWSPNAPSSSASERSLAPPHAEVPASASSSSSSSSSPQGPVAQPTKYNVTTVAAPPGTVEQESLLVMKDMLKTMADMTRRMLNMEERISRLEMEKDQLSRTVNRLQETQHQQLVRQEAPKPTFPVTTHSSSYPSGFPPGYVPANVTSTYAAVPPSYPQPAAVPQSQMWAARR